MSGNPLTLGLNILLAVLIFFGIFWGFVRGLRKSLGRAIFLLITSLLLIFLAVPITNALLGITVNATIEANGELLISGRATLKQIIEAYMEYFLGQDMVTKFPELASTLVKIPVIFINAIVYLVLFWLSKLILHPLNALFTNLVFNKKRTERMGFSAFGEGQEPHQINNTSSSFITKDERKSEEEKHTNTLIYQQEQTPQQPTETKPENIKKIQAKEKKALRKANKKDKPKKRRLLGSLVGLATGLIVTFNTMIPVYGFMNMLQTANSLKTENLTEKEFNLSDETNGVTNEIIKAYDTSIMNIVSTFTGMKALGLASFDLITTQKIEGEDVALRSEVENIIKTVESVDTLLGKYKTYTAEDGFKNVTQEQLDDLIDGARNVLTTCKEVKLVNILADYALPITCSVLLEQEIKFADQEIINTLIREMLTSLVDATGINITQEIENIIDIVDYVNEQKLLLPLVKQDLSDSFTLINTPEPDFAKNLTNKILSLQVVDVTLTNLFTLGLEFANNFVDFDITSNNISKQTITNALTEFVDNAFQTAQSLDKESPIILTYNSIKPIGRMLDVAKNSGVLNTDTYQNLVNWGVDKVKNVTKTFLPYELVDVVNNDILENISKVENWEEEFGIISDAIDILRDKDNGFLGEVDNSKELRQGIKLNFELKENTIIQIGKALDKLEQTTLLGTTTTNTIINGGTPYNATPVTKLFTALCDMFAKELNSNSDDITNKLASIIYNVKNNMIISAHKYSLNSKFFENEFKSFAPLIMEIEKLSKVESLNAIPQSLGIALDKAKSGVLFGNNVTTNLVHAVLDIAKDGLFDTDYVYSETNQTIEDKIYELVIATQNKLKTEELVNTMLKTSNFWEKELRLLDFENIPENPSTKQDFNIIGSKLDNIFSSKIVAIEELQNLIAFALSSLKNDSTTDLDLAINDLIYDISQKIKSEDFDSSLTLYKDYWTIELNYLYSLIDIKLEDTQDNPVTPEDESYKLLDNLDAIGKKLDKTTLGYTTTSNGSEVIGSSIAGKYTRASRLLTSNSIRNLMASALTEFKSIVTDGFEDPDINKAISEAISSIANNLKDTTNIPTITFEKEFTHLSNLANLSDISIDESIFTSGSENDLERLNKLGNTLDSIAYNVSLTNGVYEYNNNNSKLITRSIINQLIIDITPIIETDNVIINNAITRIAERIEELGDETLLSWKKELDKVHELVALNSTNISSPDDSSMIRILGNNIDAIAFNTDENNTKYLDGYEYYSQEKYNSIVITREILRDTVADFLSGAKEEDNTGINEIINDLITNTTATVNTTGTPQNADLYPTFSASFDALISTKEDIEELEKTYREIKLSQISENSAKDIDKFFDNLQSKLICGINTTRKIAIVILENLQTSMEDHLTPSVFNATIPGKYLAGLIAHYKNSTDIETYNDDSITEYKTHDAGTSLADDYSNISTVNPISTLVSCWQEYLGN